MQNYKSVDKNSNKTSNEENAYGYIPRNCDLKCYKCRYQGICIIPRRIIGARKRFAINNIRAPLLNNKYKLNDFPRILNGRRLLKYLINLKKKLYGKDSD